MFNSSHNDLRSTGSGQNTNNPDNRKGFYQVVISLGTDGYEAISKPFETFSEALRFYRINMQRDRETEYEMYLGNREFLINFYIRQEDHTALCVKNFFIDSVETSTVYSSHGITTRNKNTGEVIENHNTDLKQIKRFAVEEYCQYWNEPLPYTYDILDLGYYADNGEFIEPEEDFRQDVKKETRHKECQFCDGNEAEWRDDDPDYGKGWFCIECGYPIHYLPIIS